MCIFVYHFTYSLRINSYKWSYCLLPSSDRTFVSWVFVFYLLYWLPFISEDQSAQASITLFIYFLGDSTQFHRIKPTSPALASNSLPLCQMGSRIEAKDVAKYLTRCMMAPLTKNYHVQNVISATDEKSCSHCSLPWMFFLRTRLPYLLLKKSPYQRSLPWPPSLCKIAPQQSPTIPLLWIHLIICLLLPLWVM